MTVEQEQYEAFAGLRVGDIRGNFFVPHYQRGYRWGDTEVERLLDDIEQSAPGVYYLQPIVVKRMDDGRWELIDGQQRLTTLFLILVHIKQQALPSADVAYAMEYETRPRSAEYLLDPEEGGAAENIDFFHIFRAHECIRTWLGSRANPVLAAINLYQALNERVKVIWYEAPPEVDSTALFTRLNVGRIPLTDAELVKALLLSRSDHATSVASEWDSIERDLRVPELWAFLTGEAHQQATHIGLLLDTLAGGSAGRHRPQFHTFETLRERIVADPDRFWNDVVDLHSLAMGWFEDRDLFHKIGYLVATGTAFSQLLRWSEGRKRSEFESALDVAIRTHLNLSRDQLLELNYESTLGRSKLTDVLLLMNSETIRKLKNSSERYSFRAHASGQWSLEHIHAQNAEQLRTVEQWTSWLTLHRFALAGLPLLTGDELAELQSRIDAALPEIDESRFKLLEAEIAPLFSSTDPDESADDVHAITNMALLERGDNSALSNSVFEVKRLAVLERDRAGSFIPVCTRNVFLKYYTQEGAQQVHFWSIKDREAYLTAIEREVGPYLAPVDSGVRP